MYCGIVLVNIRSRQDDPNAECTILFLQLFKRFPQLKDRFHQVVINYYRKQLGPTNKLVQDLIR